ncbi:gamma-glutamyl-gamma-aminobutyrate hydrolase family protein [Lentimicrobium sp.]|uniref:gamma-glutamyl-gamma-aminobutyrate hydrolase family protein n=1 Tax=Lentimicrobium sp. TaxID=2034841 RepID=UPI002B629D4C|nr:gamma-glutamyl-gamma-aminobutyrate hydrolase family protein [Lentimicrobium sp.]HRW70508.1 gamma-glutamyl-gamma-aminobutyrate hydrolase family protein [Lentimicrobium sp.]
MRRFISVLLVVFSGLLCPAQQYFNTPAATGDPVLVLMNPTVNNLKTVFYLIDNGIFPLPEDYRLVGFYHTAQAYDFSQSAGFIRESGREGVFLHACSGLPGLRLYGENPCSDDFRLVFENSAGVIFFGGPDIPPAFYGEETNLLTAITDYHRHAFEASFLFHLTGGFQDDAFTPLLEQKPDFLVMGICLGMQTMNIAAGGTMIQDIPTEIYQLTTAEQVLAMEQDNRHRNYHTQFGLDDALMWGSFHRIKITRPEKLKFLTAGSAPHPGVLSSHHQAVEKAGKGLEVVATSMDGKIPEILLHSRYPNVIGFQFHPEPALLYKPDEKLKFDPDKPAAMSFIDLYPEAEGETFNRNIWKWAADRLSR